jgi:hypothetical protein
MKFYMLTNDVGELIGCERTLSAARWLAESCGMTRNETIIYEVDVAVNAETVRRMLSNSGGYVKRIKRIWRS